MTFLQYRHKANNILPRHILRNWDMIDWYLYTRASQIWHCEREGTVGFEHGDDVVCTQQILGSEARQEHSKREKPYCLLHGSSLSIFCSTFFLFPCYIMQSKWVVISGQILVDVSLVFPNCSNLCILKMVISRKFWGSHFVLYLNWYCSIGYFKKIVFNI